VSCWSGSSGRVPAYQAWGPDLSPRTTGADLELTILLPQLPTCWVCEHAPPYLAVFRSKMSSGWCCSSVVEYFLASLCVCVCVCIGLIITILGFELSLVFARQASTVPLEPHPNFFCMFYSFFWLLLLPSFMFTWLFCSDTIPFFFSCIFYR
jgi:hypothetical protein